MYDYESETLSERQEPQEDKRPIAFCGRYETQYRVPDRITGKGTIVVVERHGYQR